MDSKVISDYYDRLPFGQKDEFAREIAEAIEKSTSSVRLKIRKGNWSRIEMQEIDRVIKNRGECL